MPAVNPVATRAAKAIAIEAAKGTVLVSIKTRIILNFVFQI